MFNTGVVAATLDPHLVECFNKSTLTVNGNSYRGLSLANIMKIIVGLHVVFCRHFRPLQTRNRRALRYWESDLWCGSPKRRLFVWDSTGLQDCRRQDAGGIYSSTDPGCPWKWNPRDPNAPTMKHISTGPLGGVINRGGPNVGEEWRANWENKELASLNF